MVWVGREVPAGEPPPEYFPDLPRIEVLAEHHHQVQPAGIISSSFLEDEMIAVKLALATMLHPNCPQEDIGALPLDLSILYGLSVAVDNAAVIAGEIRGKTSDLPTSFAVKLCRCMLFPRAISTASSDP